MDLVVIGEFGSLENPLLNTDEMLLPEQAVKATMIIPMGRMRESFILIMFFKFVTYF